MVHSPMAGGRRHPPGTGNQGAERGASQSDEKSFLLEI